MGTRAPTIRLVDLRYVLDRMGRPPAITSSAIAHAAGQVGEARVAEWFSSRRTLRPRKKVMEIMGYERVANPDDTLGLWLIDGERCVAYSNLSRPADQLAAVRDWINSGRIEP